MSAIEVDTTRLPLLLQQLRLPAVARLWPQFTERSDKEGNLRELEHTGLVARTKRENGSADIEVYALTELGSNLHPAFKALGSFGGLLARKCVGGSN